MTTCSVLLAVDLQFEEEYVYELVEAKLRLSKVPPPLYRCLEL
jgi:hypothetical protein